VRGRLAPGIGWSQLLRQRPPPGSVLGAPKSSALRAIADLEPVPRGPYCGAFGWVDADARRACLAVGIRTFWQEDDRLHFGTGAGITWGSDPELEWRETELKAERLIGLAGRQTQPDPRPDEREIMTTLWVDGVLGGPEDARVAATDHGLTVGDGVFETCKVVDGRPFALTRHLRRLARSAAVLGLEVPQDAVLRRAVDDVLVAHQEREGDVTLGRLRLTLTGGPGPLGSERAPGTGTLVVAVTATAPWPADIAVATVPWARNERSAIAGAKTTSYAENVVALAEAKRRGAHEALFANTTGRLCEGTGSNVIVLDGDVLATPPLASGCLAGITRELLLEWAAEEGLPVVERDLPVDVLATAPDVLLTSSTRDVQPVAVVDGRAVPGSELGRAAAAMFAARAAKDLDP
jgi:branched-chain amino acid aminotransferase